MEQLVRDQKKKQVEQTAVKQITEEELHQLQDQVKEIEYEKVMEEKKLKSGRFYNFAIFESDFTYKNVVNRFNNLSYFLRKE